MLSEDHRGQWVYRQQEDSPNHAWKLVWFTDWAALSPLDLIESLIGNHITTPGHYMTIEEASSTSPRVHTFEIVANGLRIKR